MYNYLVILLLLQDSKMYDVAVRIEIRTWYSESIGIVLFSFFFSGMKVRYFKGFQTLQEIECSAEYLKTEVKILSIKMFTVPGNIVLAHANPMTNECLTFKEFSSCNIDTGDTRKSRLRVLVSDLDEGESRRYGCKATSFGSLGDTDTSTWHVTVNRKSEC